LKVVLINPPDVGVFWDSSPTAGKTIKGRFSNKEAPLGLAYIAAAVEEAGIEVELIDCAGRDMDRGQIEKAIDKSQPDLVGITTLTATLQSAFALSKILKQTYPNIPVVFGGHGAFLIERNILENIGSVDIIVQGEGEETIVELANVIQHHKSYKDVSGITFRDKTSVFTSESRPLVMDLDALPLPARHLLPMENYVVEYMPKVLGRESFKGTPLISSRGCPFHCVFCASSKFYGHAWRKRSPDNVIQEIEYLRENYGNLGLNGFSFSDDNFTQDEERAIRICDIMIERGLSNMKWCCEARINAVNPHLYSKMYDAGCRFVAFGIESGNEQILKRIKKGITKEMVRKAVKTAKHVGMKTWGYFLLGLPDDTEETMMDTIEFSESLDLDLPVFHAAYIYPGTEMGEELNIDWLNFVVKEELTQPSIHNYGFHPCVPTYQDRNHMKEMIKYVMKRKRQEKIFNRIFSKIRRIQLIER
jgi:radical SAM superfamily enzyme YgiQ (UPF0313 family)